MKKSEMKLVKSYQMLSQYLIYSIKHLNKKNAIITDLAEQQYRYNEVADDIIKRQKVKIRQLEEENNDLDNNLISMEFLVKHLGLDKMIAKLGLNTDFMKDNDHVPMNEKEISKIKEELKSSDYFHGGVEEEVVSDDE